VSRIQQSSLGTMRTRTRGNRAARAKAKHRDVTPTVKDSKREMAAASVQKACCTGNALSRQLSGRSGHSTQQPAWRSNSAGIQNPSACGVPGNVIMPAMLTCALEVTMRHMISRTVIILWAAVVFSATSDAQGSAAGALNKTQLAVLDAESHRFRAQVERDAATLRLLMADEVSYTHSTGVRQDKTEYIADIETGKTIYRSIEASDQKVRLYGSTAIVTGTVKLSVTNAGVAREVSLAYTDIHVKRQGRWQLVAWQSTAAPVASPSR
jgi:hypothetical protein